MTRKRRPKTVAAVRPAAAYHRAKNQFASRAGSKPGRWYDIRNSLSTAEIYLFDEIGLWGISAQDFVRDLADLDGVTSIELHVNSPGGDVFDAVAIYNALRRHSATVTTYIDGLAASAASFIAMAGDTVLIEPTGTFMIHDASGVSLGNAEDMREMATLLDKTSDTIASIYAAAAGGTTAQWRKAMQAETWYSAEEAVTAGLADRVLTVEPRNTMPLTPFVASIRRQVELGVRSSEIDTLIRKAVATWPAKTETDTDALLRDMTKDW